MGGSLLLYLHSVLFAHTYLDLLLGSLHDFNDLDLKASLKPMSMCRPGPSHGPLHHPRLSICSGFFAAAPWLMVVVMMMVTMVTMALLLLMVVLTVLLMVSNIMVIILKNSTQTQLGMFSQRLCLTHWHLDAFGTLSCRYCYSHSVGADQAQIFLDRASRLDIFAQNRRLRTSPCVCLGGWPRLRKQSPPSPHRE